MVKSILVLAYKDTSGFFLAAGQQRRISCNHQNEGTFYINTVGEIIPLPQATQIPLSGESTTDYNAKNVLVPQGNVYASSTQFGDSGYKTVVRIKDMESLVTTWVDSASYTTNVVKCNAVPYVIGCPAATGFSSGTPGATTATITWTAVPGATGYEYINNTSSSAPVVDGTFTETTSISLTGLTAATTYHFWLRTICGGGSAGESAYVSAVYTTHA